VRDEFRENDWRDAVCQVTYEATSANPGTGRQPTLHWSSQETPRKFAPNIPNRNSPSKIAKSMQKETAARLPTPPPPVQLINLRKVYGDVVAVDGISLTMETGKVTALLGGNGAGKTTTIAMLLGLVVPTSGEVRVLGADMLTERQTVLHRINFESPYVVMPQRLTVAENLEVFGRLYGLRDLKGRIGEVAADMQIEDLMQRPVGELSAGQKTRIALAKALLNAPELLLLDEPTASLDPDTADWVRNKLEAFMAHYGSTLVLASHNMAEVERMAHRVVMLDHGRIVADDTPNGLIEAYGRENLEDVFLDIVRGRERAVGSRQ
jgi:ABC-2 type transport system ATP-binding protein